MDLEKALDAFDGRHKDALEALAAKLAPEPAVIAALCTIAGREAERLQAGATWLLKHFQENGLAFSPDQTEALLDLLERVSHWEAKLHLLQILPGLTLSPRTLPKARRHALLKRLRGEGYLAEPNKFVRAWSYNALAVLATQHAEFRPAVAALLKAGAEEEAAAVRARIRNVVKAAPWAQEF